MPQPKCAVGHTMCEIHIGPKVCYEKAHTVVNEYHMGAHLCHIGQKSGFDKKNTEEGSCELKEYTHWSTNVIPFIV
jgi:hypothetical protein